MLPRWRRSRRTCKTVLAASWHCAYITLCWLGQDGGEVLVGLNPAQGFNGSNNSELWRIDWIMVPEPFKSSFLSHNQRSKWHDQLLTCFAFVINLVAPGFVCTFTKQAIFDQCDLGSLPHLLPCGLDRADLSVC